MHVVTERDPCGAVFAAEVAVLFCVDAAMEPLCFQTLLLKTFLLQQDRLSERHNPWVKYRQVHLKVCLLCCYEMKWWRPLKNVCLCAIRHDFLISPLPQCRLLQWYLLRFPGCKMALDMIAPCEVNHLYCFAQVMIVL